MKNKKIYNEEELVQYLIDNNILCVLTNNNLHPNGLRKVLYKEGNLSNFDLMGSITNLLTFKPSKFVYTNPSQTNLEVLNKKVFISNRPKRMDRVKGVLYFITKNHYLITTSEGADILATEYTTIEYDYTEDNFDIIEKL